MHGSGNRPLAVRINTHYPTHRAPDGSARRPMPRFFRAMSAATHALRTSPRLSWDRFGAGLSALCLVHCLTWPLALGGLSVFAASSAFVWHEAFHVGVALAAVPAAVLAGIPGYRRHRDARPLALLVLGSLALVVSFVAEGAVGHAGALVLTGIGGTLLLAGHLANAACRARA